MVNKERQIIGHEQYLFLSDLTLRLVNNPNRMLHQSIACRHFEDATLNVNISISTASDRNLTGSLLYNDSEKLYLDFT
jgi:hypothetical protein